MSFRALARRSARGVSLPRRIGLPVGALMLMGALAGCMDNLSQVRQQMPEREILSFASQLSTGNVVYACARGESEQETRSRGAEAHRAYEAKVVAYGPEFADMLVAALEQQAASSQAGVAGVAQAVNQRSDAWSEAAALDIERDYRCLPVERD